MRGRQSFCKSQACSSGVETTRVLGRETKRKAASWGQIDISAMMDQLCNIEANLFALPAGAGDREGRSFNVPTTARQCQQNVPFALRLMLLLQPSFLQNVSHILLDIQAHLKSRAQRKTSRRPAHVPTQTMKLLKDSALQIRDYC